MKRRSEKKNFFKEGKREVEVKFLYKSKPIVSNFSINLDSILLRYLSTAPIIIYWNSQTGESWQPIQNNFAWRWRE